MRNKAMTRGEMIDRLVEDSVRAVLKESQRPWLAEIFENGCVGYRKLSDRQLLMELRLRGLAGAGDMLDEYTEDADTDEELMPDMILQWTPQLPSRKSSEQG